jgi:hypothetical protein
MMLPGNDLSHGISVIHGHRNADSFLNGIAIHLNGMRTQRNQTEIDAAELGVGRHRELRFGIDPLLRRRRLARLIEYPLSTNFPASQSSSSA